MARRSSVYISKFNSFVATRPPLVTDDGAAGAYIGQDWIDTSASPAGLYRCVSNKIGAAQWRELSEPSSIGSVGPTPSALVFPILFSQFTGIAATSGSITLFSLPAGGKILSVDILQPSTVPHFAGPSITAAHLELGITGTLAKYAAACDVFTAGSNSGLNTTAGYESLTAATPILLTAVVVGANLSVLTAGQATVAVTVANPLSIR